MDNTSTGQYVASDFAKQHTALLSGRIAERRKSREIRAFSNNEKLVDKRRAKIIKGALKLFRQRGIKGVTMIDVAKASRMSIGSLYRYFGSKDDLLYAIWRNYEDNLNEYLLKKLSEIENYAPQDALKEFIESYIHTIDASRDQILILYLDTRSMSKADQAAVKEGDAHIIRIIEHILNRGVESGIFQIDNVKLAAHNIKALADLWAIRGWTLKDIASADIYIQEQIKFIINTISVNTKTLIPL